MFGNSFNEEQPAKIFLIFLILDVFQFEISGKDVNDEQPQKIEFKLSILIIFQFEISGILVIKRQLQNK